MSFVIKPEQTRELIKFVVWEGMKTFGKDKISAEKRSVVNQQEFVQSVTDYLNKNAENLRLAGGSPYHSIMVGDLGDTDRKDFALAVRDAVIELVANELQRIELREATSRPDYKGKIMQMSTLLPEDLQAEILAATQVKTKPIEPVGNDI